MPVSPKSKGAKREKKSGEGREAGVANKECKKRKTKKKDFPQL